MSFCKQIQSSLTAKVILFVICGLLLSLSILGLANYYNARSILINDAEELLVDQSTSYAKEVGLWLNASEQEVSLLATMPSIVNSETDAALAFLWRKTCVTWYNGSLSLPNNWPLLRSS